MIRTTVIGTCIFCLKLKAVRLTEPRLIPSRREGVCTDCEHKMPKAKIQLRVNYKQ